VIIYGAVANLRKHNCDGRRLNNLLVGDLLPRF
jgi:hypothetical protein